RQTASGESAKHQRQRYFRNASSSAGNESCRSVPESSLSDRGFLKSCHSLSSFLWRPIRDIICMTSPRSPGVSRKGRELRAFLFSITKPVIPESPRVPKIALARFYGSALTREVFRD